jgi:Ala-tRNA(Pro) deacylase
MRIAKELRRFLDRELVPYELLAHPRTETSTETAAVTGVTGEALAKAVVIDDQRRFMVAIIPATHRLELGTLHQRLGQPVGLATEAEVRLLFEDCEDGAVPGLAQAYGLDVVVDDALLDLDDVYFEAGNHADLVHVTGDKFRDLMSSAEHGEISRHV